jgi:Protein of unknown function (DUF3738)
MYGPVYALMVEKSGSKTKVNDSPQDYEIPIQGGPGGVTVGKRVSMEYLCYVLGQMLRNDDRAVIDKTGFTGNYDFMLTFLPDSPPGFDKLGLKKAGAAEGASDVLRDRFGGEAAGPPARKPMTPFGQRGDGNAVFVGGALQTGSAQQFQNHRRLTPRGPAARAGALRFRAGGQPMRHVICDKREGTMIEHEVPGV